MFFAIKKMVNRLLCTLLAVVLYVGVAVQLPDYLRWLQRGVGNVLSFAETQLTVPSQYFVWLEMSGIDAVLIFALFYLLSTFLLTLWWRFLKASLKACGRGLKALWNRSLKRKSA